MSFALSDVFEALDQANCRYVVVGGLAVILHGHLRATHDLDLVIDLEQENCERAMRALGAIGLRPRLPVDMAQFADPSTRTDWHENRNMLVFQLWDPARETRSVDVFVKDPVAFDELYAQSVLKPFFSTQVRIASIDHMIFMKRLASRPRDLNDIEALQKLKAIP